MHTTHRISTMSLNKPGDVLTVQVDGVTKFSGASDKPVIIRIVDGAIESVELELAPAAKAGPTGAGSKAQPKRKPSDSQ